MTIKNIIIKFSHAQDRPFSLAVSLNFSYVLSDDGTKICKFLYNWLIFLSEKSYWKIDKICDRKDEKVVVFNYYLLLLRMVMGIQTQYLDILGKCYITE